MVQKEGAKLPIINLDNREKRRENKFKHVSIKQTMAVKFKYIQFRNNLLSFFCLIKKKSQFKLIRLIVTKPLNSNSD